MKDIVEFEKLFKVTFPVLEHHQYYIDTLAKNAFYAGLPNVVKEYEQFERDVVSLGYSSVKSYKLDYALPKLKNYLLGSEAYNNLMSWDIPDKLRTKDELRHHDDKMLMSIDFKSANYSALRTFDSAGELGTDWDDLCSILDIHPTLAKSKSFRQYVFGNTNPKRLQRRQHSNIIKIVDALIKDYGFVDSDFVFISHDEIIVKVVREIHESKGFVQGVGVNIVHVVNTAIGEIIQREGIGMPTHYKLFINHAIGKGMCVQSIHEIKGTSFVLKYDTLFKVPGNKFFKYFKKRILHEPLDRRDLMFTNDGEVAVWAEEEDSIVERITPEGEMSMEEINSSYPYLVQKLREGVPGVNDSQIRKMINVFMDVCPACHNAESGCHCWNDE